METQKALVKELYDLLMRIGQENITVTFSSSFKYEDYTLYPDELTANNFDICATLPNGAYYDLE